MPVSAAHALTPGSALLEYRIDALLASGAFGLTYLAHDTQMNARAAIREYLPIGIAARGRDAQVEPLFPREGELLRQAVGRFMEESRLLAAIRHPNVLRVLRLFEANGTAYMVMEYEAGTTLYDWRARVGRPSEAMLLRILGPLLDGLQAMHDAGVLHRDLKPTKIRLRADGTPVILDFGAAHHLPLGKVRDAMLQVTLGYSPLENYYSGGNRGAWSDLYSLAAVAHWLMTGDLPDEAPARMLHDALPSLQTLFGADYSRNFLAALDWALALDVNERPQEARILRNALEAAMSDEPNVAPPIAASSVADSTHTFVPEPALLAEARNELARHLGPIANVVARKALDVATDWRSFCNAVASHITDGASRQSFLEQFSGRAQPSVGAAVAAHTAAAAKSAPSFDPTLLAGLEAELAGYLGAIAKVVVRRSAREARNKGDLYERIGAELDDPVRTRKFVAWAESKFGLT